MSARGGRQLRISDAYRAYKADACGWGVPDFADFRARLWPLRTQRDKAKWPDDDMVLVMELQEEGADLALRRFFTVGGRLNPVAAEVLGAEPRALEPMARAELDRQLRTLVRACKASNWTPGEFMAYIDYLDSEKTPADVAPLQEADGTCDDSDLFADAYRRAGKGYKRLVREVLAGAAGSAPT